MGEITLPPLTVPGSHAGFSHGLAIYMNQCFHMGDAQQSETVWFFSGASQLQTIKFVTVIQSYLLFKKQND